MSNCRFGRGEALRYQHARHSRRTGAYGTRVSRAVSSGGLRPDADHSFLFAGQPDRRGASACGRTLRTFQHESTLSNLPPITAPVGGAGHQCTSLRTATATTTAQRPGRRRRSRPLRPEPGPPLTRTCGGQRRGSGISQAGAHGLVQNQLLSARHIGDDLGSTSHVESLVGPASVSHSSESPRQPVKKIRSPARAASTTSRCARSTRRRAHAGARGFPPSKGDALALRQEPVAHRPGCHIAADRPASTHQSTSARYGRPPAILSDPCSQPVHEVQDFWVRSRLTDHPRWCRRARRDWR